MQPHTITLASLTAKTIPADFVAMMDATLLPQGPLECFFAAAIVRAAWKIQNEAPDAEKQTLTMRRDTAELRRLQTDRRLNEEHGLNLPALVSVKDFLRCRSLSYPHKGPARGKAQVDEPSPEKLAEMIHHLDSVIEGDLKKRSQFGQLKAVSTPRNAPCPCGSRQKHKRCCGKGAPPVLNRAA